MIRSRGSASPAKRFKFVCLGCNILGFEGGICVCRYCGVDVKRLKKVEALILKKYPGLRNLTTPEIFLRLWVDRLKSELPSREVTSSSLEEAFALQKKIEGSRASEPEKGTAA